MKIKPLYDHVLVARRAPDEKVGSLFIPPSATNKSQQAVVMAVGPGHMRGEERVPLTVKVGDVVVLGDYTGVDVALDGEKFVMIREADILCIVE